MEELCLDPRLDSIQLARSINYQYSMVNRNNNENLRDPGNDWLLGGSQFPPKKRIRGRQMEHVEGTGRGEACHRLCFKEAAFRQQRGSGELSIPSLEEGRGTVCEHTALGMTVITPCSPPQSKKAPAAKCSTCFSSTPWGKGQEAQAHGL